jgi:hypothetical protein
MLAMKTPVQIFDTVSYSVHTLQQHTQDIIFGGRHYKVPDWKAVFEATAQPRPLAVAAAATRVRASIVLNRYNRHEMYELLNYLATTNVDYIQIRKVCTDTRLAQHEPDMAAFEEWVAEFDRMAGGPTEMFEDAPQYRWAGKKVSVWRTVGTSVNSLNYFTDGTIGATDYFVVEGYVKANNLKL